ncbi:MAG: carbohydrate binding family 9 domain-containing protein [Gemmatimonadota bacterium]|nr:carbohydrate binding family 9 domain-containing protein [Gemmatimonadota bacterium]
MKRIIRALLCSTAMATALAAQTSAPTPPLAAAAPVMHAARLAGTIQIDGHLDEPAWANAEPNTHFTQSYPEPGAAPTQRTEVRVLYDNDALYVGIRAFDTHPDSIAAQLARRDATGIYSDWLHVTIDSYHDRRTAFRFAVNPLGVQKDALEFNDTNEDLNWDAVWEVATSRDSLGWTAEYRIPFSQLRFGREAPDVARDWGIQVQRDIARNNERDSWAPWTQKDAGYVSRFGDLVGLVNVPVPERLEIVPYVSAKLTRAPGSASDPFYHHNDTKPSVGGDIKYGLPGGLTLTGTVNPDFGQVEVDPAVVNLTAYETFFPEKRPFFIEGSGIFNFGQIRYGPSYNFQQLFYSRRIGRAPQRVLNNTEYVDSPDQTTILSAAKISGKTGPWTVGFLDAVTAEENAQYLSSAGVRGTAPVEPLSNYAVGRVQRDFRDGNTVIGGMFTTTNRSLSDTSFQSILRSRADMGGLDFEHQWDNHAWGLAGYAAGTSVAGSASVIAATQRSSTHYYQRPDATYLHYDSTRTALDGHIAELALRRSGTVTGSLDLKESSPGFEVNDLGFQGRTDYRSVAGSIGYNSYDPGRLFRQWSVFAGDNNAWNFGGDRIWNSMFASANGTFSNLSSANLNVEVDPSAVDDRLTRGGPRGRQPSTWTISASGTSDTRRVVSASLQGTYAGDVAGGDLVAFGPTLTIRPSASVLLSLGPNFSSELNTIQYVTTASDPLATETYGARYILAGLQQKTLSMDTRLSWTFTPKLSLQLYAQPFVSSGRYAKFKQLLEPGTQKYGVFGQNFGTITRDNTGAYTLDPDGAGPAPAISVGNPDFNVRSLRGDAVMRWEYRPGSALFFVWQQQRSGFVPSGDFSASRDVGAIFRETPTNVFLVKATFWIAR